ncbi:sodium:solute symporter family transporter [Stutzerimonas chloritidismutans]|uniref:sodium:solute symporter family transporter n=1 Tax=Stutzerimonas chloritidismutans TaxID=203192 RepID=UPI003F135314
MQALDLAVLAGYVLFIIGAAWCFRRMASDSSQYINGGGSMQWWMAGATAFMTQFSAWTFTGAAGKAYTDGFAVLMLFWGNALGFFVASRFFAARYRKLRVETSMQVIALRFGRPTERLFTWLQLPLSTLSAAVWLNGLAYIISAMTGLGMVPVLLATGLIITFIASSGGAWTVSATNVIQLVLILAITLVTGAYALYVSGGPVQLVTDFPGDFWMGREMTMPGILVLWVAVILMQQTVSTNNAITCYRFLVTRNEHEAQRAALLAGVLFVIGPVMWFIPPWAAATGEVSLAAHYPQLGGQATNAAYLFFVEQAMPVGTLGLTMAAMLAATIAPMSAALNRNAGIFIRNVYQRRQHSEPRLVRVGRLFTLGNGLLATLVAWWMSQQTDVNFFDLVLMISSMLLLPMSIPAMLAVLVRRTPDWAGWSTVAVGGLVSAGMYFGFGPSVLPAWLGGERLSAREAGDLRFAATVVAHLLLTGGYFFATSLLYRARVDRGRRQQLRRMFADMYRGLQPAEMARVDPTQARLLGGLLMGLCVLLLALPWLAEDARGLWLHAAIALTVGTVGVALRRLARSG